MRSRDRAGREVETFDGQGKAAAFLYTTRPGRVLVRLLIRPWVSKTVGWCLNRRLSACFIRPFVKKNHIDLAEYEGAPYRSYNAFFCRRIQPERRPADATPDALIAPCDSKLTAYRIGEDTRFTVKGTEYTMAELTRDEALAQRYHDGWLLLFRLTVDDYHHYCFSADGTVGETVTIPGVFHTVNPVAAGVCPIYKENTRTLTLLHTAACGDILMIEVGAMMVGRIVNYPTDGAVRRGQEKGHFEFGGSTVILCIQPGSFTPDADILHNSADHIETIVKMGEHIGKISFNTSEPENEMV